MYIDHCKVSLLKEAQNKAYKLFSEIDQRNLVQAGKTEKDLSNEVFALAKELFCIEKYWHKRIVRTGQNTLCTYSDNPPNLTVREDDILFFDFGPIFEGFEADFGMTYVLGNSTEKLKLKDDLETIFQRGKDIYRASPDMTGADFFSQIKQLSEDYGWLYGGPYCGHLIGEFPHEIRCGEFAENYICLENDKPMSEPDKDGKFRHWILEIHLINQNKQWGGFFEDLLTV